MKAYHTIEKYTSEYFGKHVFGFDKIDGSNFRAEWNKKLSKKNRSTYGFGKFGTKTELIDKNSLYIEGVNIFMEKYSHELDKIFNENRLLREIPIITVFGEFFGKHSFAGQHDWNEEHDIIIYDMFLYKKDYLKPATFMDIFENLDMPYLKYEGLLDESIINNIESNVYGVKEGLVLKGVNEGKVFMIKVKTLEWLNKVREKYGINNNYE
jgi:hypothetical protein